MIQTSTATCNNLVVVDEWKDNEKKTIEKEDPKFLALSSQFEDLKKYSGESISNSGNQNSGSNEHWRKNWRFKNTDQKVGKETTRNR